MDTNSLRLILLKRDSSDRIDRAADELAAFLRSQPDTELLTVSVIEDLDAATLDGSEVVVVLGGDGAMIRACRQLGQHQLPIIGINLGRLGFLADLTQDQFQERFNEIRTRNFEVVEHLMFACTMTRLNGESESWLGVNEAAVSAEATLQMVEVALSIDDANRRYRLELPSARTEVVLVIDGQIRVPFQVGDRVDIGKADVTFKLVRLSGHNYYSVLQNKLGWSGQPRYSADD